MERERKFLVSRAPVGLRRYPHKPIRQGYLAIPEDGKKSSVEVRVRDEDGKHFITVKEGSGHARTEVEVPIRKDAFRSLWRLTTGKRVEKETHLYESVLRLPCTRDRFLLLQ